jgi:hypothetical protein
MSRPEAAAPQEPADWQQLAPVLDELIGQLPRADREAILLRYYRDFSFAEVAEQMGVTPDAARKRVERGVEKLRQLAAEKGGALSAASLAAGLATFVRIPPPPGLVATATVAATAPAGSAMAASTTTIVKGALTMMTTTKLTFVSVTVVAIVLLGGLISGAVWMLADGQSDSAISQVPVTAATMTLDIKAQIDGSDVVNITPEGVALTHISFQLPSHITLNGTVFSPQGRLRLDQIGLSGADLSSATVLHRSGRGTVAMEKTENGLAIHFADPQSGAAPYEITMAFLPKSANGTSPPPISAATRQSGQSVLLDVKATIAGSDVLTITPQSAQWQHVAMGLPSNVTINNRPWKVDATPVLGNIGLDGADLSSARVVEKSGRDTVVMEKADGALTIYFCDTPGGTAPYEIKIRLSRSWVPATAPTTVPAPAANVENPASSLPARAPFSGIRWHG